MEQLTGENIAAKLQEFLEINDGCELTSDYILDLLYYIECVMELTDNKTAIENIIDEIKQFHWERSKRYNIKRL